MNKLFQPTRMGKISVENRVFMAPLTRNRAESNGVPKKMAATYYGQRAEGGLLITEATQINAAGKGYIDTPGIYNAEQVKGWQTITQAVHQAGGKIFLQLWHVGRISHTSLQPNNQDPVAPSAIQAEAQTYAADGMVDVSKPRALTIAEIAETIEDFKNAAQCAKNAGFDGVEIHAANGYLINQFLSSNSNQRDDAYGGSAENRVRFLKEVTEAVLDVWEAGSVGVRLSPTGTFNDMHDNNPRETFSTAIQLLNNYSLAYMHFVERFPGMETSEEDNALIKELRALWKGFYIANGDYNREHAIDVVESGYADAVAFGRPYIANPDLVERLRQNASLNKPDDSTFYGGGEEGYIDYPFLEDKAA